jgi:hypothetical protein
MSARAVATDRYYGFGARSDRSYGELLLISGTRSHAEVAYVHRRKRGADCGKIAISLSPPGRGISYDPGSISQSAPSVTSHFYVQHPLLQ